MPFCTSQPGDVIPGMQLHTIIQTTLLSGLGASSLDLQQVYMLESPPPLDGSRACHFALWGDGTGEETWHELANNTKQVQ